MAQKKHSAFTLIEMVIVLFIISLLLLIIIPNVNQQKKSAESKTNHAFRTTLQTQVDMYEGQHPTWEILRKEHYLSDAQAKKAIDDGYKIEAGNVVAPHK